MAMGSVQEKRAESHPATSPDPALWVLQALGQRSYPRQGAGSHRVTPEAP